MDKLGLWTLLLTALATAKEEDNKQEKRGVQGGAYSYSHVIHDHGPYHAPSPAPSHGYVPPPPVSYYTPGPSPTPHSYVTAAPVYDKHHNLNAVIKTITKEVPVHVYQPYLVQVGKAVPYPVKVGIPVPVARPYPVAVHKPYPAAVEKPYQLLRPVPVAVFKPVVVPTHVPYPAYVKSPEYDGYEDDHGGELSDGSYYRGGGYHSEYNSGDKDEDDDHR